MTAFNSIWIVARRTRLAGQPNRGPSSHFPSFLLLFPWHMRIQGDRDRKDRSIVQLYHPATDSTRMGILLSMIFPSGSVYGTKYYSLT